MTGSRLSGLRRAVVAVALVAVVGATGGAAFSGSHQGYTVRAGDTIDALAHRFGVTPAALVAANRLSDANTIFVGQILAIPGRGGVTTAATAPATPAAGPLAAVFAPASGSPRFPAGLRAHPSRLALRPVFQRWGAAYGVPAGLLEALAWMESGWQANVVSSTGAVGVGQLEPSTVHFVSTALLGRRSDLNPRDPNANIRMSAAYLAWLLRQTGGSVANALGAYYQGIRSLRSRGPLADTRRYVAGIGGFWRSFRSG